MWLANRKSPENDQQYSPPLKRDLWNFLFWLVSEAYEKLSLIITANKALQRVGRGSLKIKCRSLPCWIDYLRHSLIYNIKGRQLPGSTRRRQRRPQVGENDTPCAESGSGEKILLENRFKPFDLTLPLCSTGGGEFLLASHNRL